MSCLFNSLQFFIPSLSSQEIRNRICDYLEENGPVIEGVETSLLLSLDGAPAEYISNMREPSTWGGAIEIQAACNIWNICVTVQNRRGDEESDIEFIPVVGGVERSVVLEWTGGHYEPVR